MYLGSPPQLLKGKYLWHIMTLMLAEQASLWSHSTEIRQEILRSFILVFKERCIELVKAEINDITDKKKQCFFKV